MNGPRRTYRCYLCRDEGSRAHVYDRPKYRRHLTTSHHHDLVRTNRPGGYFIDSVVRLSDQSLDRRMTHFLIKNQSPALRRISYARLARLGSLWEPNAPWLPAEGEDNGGHHYDRGVDDEQRHVKFTGPVHSASPFVLSKASSSSLNDKDESGEQCIAVPLTNILVELDDAYVDENLLAGAVNSQLSVHR